MNTALPRSRLRVAMITDHSESGESVDGGVQAVTRYLVEGFKRRKDVDLHVLSFRYGVETGRTVNEEGYTRHVLPGASLGTLTAFKQDQRTMDAVLATIRPDIVHGQGVGHNGIMAVRSRWPSVVTIHGIMAEEAKHLSGVGRRVRHWLLSKLSNHYCISRGRHTILISPYVADYFRDRLAGRQYAIPNPIADAFFTVARDEVPYRVLFAGRLYRLKGVLDLVKAVSIVAESRLVELNLAGSTDDAEYVRLVKEEAVRRGIDEHVHFKGLLAEDALRRQLAKAAVLVLPSYQETAPMVIVEAMAAGVPVIATDVGGTRHLVADGETGYLVEPGNPERLAQHLSSLLADSTCRHRFGNRARELAGEQYRGDAVVARTIEVYRHVLDAVPE